MPACAGMTVVDVAPFPSPLGERVASGFVLKRQRDVNPARSVRGNLIDAACTALVAPASALPSRYDVLPLTRVAIAGGC